MKSYLGQRGEQKTHRCQYEDRDDDIFDLPVFDAFPTSDMAEKAQEKQKKSTEDEFVDAATFLSTNELAGNDSFSHDITENWQQRHASCRPSDFFERKSRNLDHVELSSPRNMNECQNDDKVMDDMYKSPQQVSSSTNGQDVVLHDHFGRSSGLSGSGTAFSSGYEVHFDNARLMYTPRSLKYLQKKSRLRVSKRHNADSPNHTVANYSGEAEVVTKTMAQSSPDAEISENLSPEYVATLQRGPGVIKEALHEIDGFIDNSIQLASAVPTKSTLGVELSDYIRKFAQDYERPPESMLPLSRTTDSWGEDTCNSQNDDDVCRQSQGLESPCSEIESTGQSRSGMRRSRSQEMLELDTIREVPCLSNTNSQSQQSSSSRKSYLYGRHSPAVSNHGFFNDTALGKCADKSQHNSEANYCSDKPLSGEASTRWNDSKLYTALPNRDQLQDREDAAQIPFRDEANLSKNSDRVSCRDSHDDVSNSASYEDSADLKRDQRSGIRGMSRSEENEFATSQSNDVDPNSVRFYYGESDDQSCGAASRDHKNDQQYAELESRLTAARKQSVASDKHVDVPGYHMKCYAAMDIAMIPRRCRRFLCSVGDVMTEQIIFTNGTQSAGRICVSLLPLSTGCRQFSVSPAVLELGPKTSSAFHITFNARYVGAVSGIFQFRGVGIESLFHPYEVVIEASVKRQSESEAPSSLVRGQQCSDTHATNKLVHELQARSTADQVTVTPTFIRFDDVQSENGVKVLRKAKLCLVNNTTQTLPFRVRAPENLSVSPAFSLIQPASEINVSVLPISQPLGQHRCGDISSVNSFSEAEEDWWSTLIVRVGKTYVYKVSVMIDRQVIQTLPPFDEIARSRHHLSSQTDSFYYTKRGKRRGLYFHPRAVEFGCCNVGESRKVPVYVCNGSKTPMTVFLQDLQDPFSSVFSSTTIEPQKFIEVMVTFTPKVVGKVATSLFAYSLSDKAVVTLIARGT